MRRHTGLFGFFLLIVVPLVGASHLYFARRLVLDPGFPTETLWAIALLGLSILASPFVRARARPRLARLVTLPAAVWLGVGFLLLVALLASDLALGLLALAVPSAEAAPASVAVDARTQATVVLGLVSMAGAAGLVAALQPPAVRRLDLSLPRWPRLLDGFRIVQLSDVHVGPMRGRAFVESLVARVNALRADLVVVTGDLVDGRVERLAGEVAPFAGLRATHGVFFVTGNHEYFSRADPWVEQLASLGWTPLRNRWLTIGREEASFDLAGVDDRYARALGPDHGENLAVALDGRDPERTVVLLAHNPTVFDEAAARGVDLQLSGHTHGGQIWPFGYVVRLFIRYVAGRYEKNRSQLYVSRGTGFWGPPLRLFAPAEITEIIVRGAADKEEPQ